MYLAHHKVVLADLHIGPLLLRRGNRGRSEISCSPRVLPHQGQKTRCPQNRLLLKPCAGRSGRFGQEQI